MTKADGNRSRADTVTFYRVEVSDERGQVVVIEPHMLAGCKIGPREDAVIRQAIRQLSGFIGMSPAARESGCVKADPTLPDGGNTKPESLGYREPGDY